jgi:5-methylcytosine-specific restriction endonuclease McrA
MCKPCEAERLKKAYRVANGIDLGAGPAAECEECGGELNAADNHRTVTMIRRYCSAGCRYRAKCRRRRVQRAGRPVERYAAVEVFERDGWACRLCGEGIERAARWPAPLSASIDHVVPVSLGGADVLANVQAAHLSCNILKSNRAVA